MSVKLSEDFEIKPIPEQVSDVRYILIIPSYSFSYFACLEVTIRL